ncbi:hypothetical protein LINBF2_13090 [Limnohabitans sp. INBF002]|nr:hypothetical protein LINBF2_13090 [Limnohabitans sp. INBF002]
MVVLLAIVTVSVCAVVPVSLPMVKPLTSALRFKLVTGQDSALVKDVALGCKVNVPLV